MTPRQAKPGYVVECRAGLTPEQFHTMVADCGGRCAICDTLTTKVNVDHDHHTGAVRGLLCTSCNIFIGYIEKSKRRHLRAQAYLRRFA
jgi:hypothetical protein